MIEHLLNCPFCNKAMLINDEDTLYSSGFGWIQFEGYRAYYPFREKEDLDGVCYKIVCEISQGGCGAQMNGDTRQETIDKWNTRTLKGDKLI